MQSYHIINKILKFFSSQDRPCLRANIIGLDGQKGKLESFLGESFSPTERSLVDETLDELQKRGLIVPAYKDVISRGEDLQITEAGLRACESGCLDDLDDQLSQLESRVDLVSLRRGAYEASLARRTDWQRHVATSLVELIDGTLHAIAPDNEVKNQPHFKPDNDASNGITRKMRIRFFLKSNNKARVVEKACDLIRACQNELQQIKHTDKKDVEELITLVDTALRYLFS